MFSKIFGPFSFPTISRFTVFQTFNSKVNATAAAAWAACWTIHQQTRFNPAYCAGSASHKYAYWQHEHLNIIPPPVTINRDCASIQEFFTANPAMVPLVRICADLSNIIYCATDDTGSSKEVLTREISKWHVNNPLLSKLELVDSWRDGAVFLHKESKLLFCVARGTEISLSTTCIRDLINDAKLLAGVPAQSRLMSFIDRVNNAKKLYPDYTVLTTGHSLGGAIAHDYAMHHPNAYSIVFSPGGTSADRTNSSLDGKTWLTSNPNIVAFKPRDDKITRWFDCPGITILTESTGHNIMDNSLVSSPFSIGLPHDQSHAASPSHDDPPLRPTNNTEHNFPQHKATTRTSSSTESTGKNQTPATWVPTAMQAHAMRQAEPPPLPTSGLGFSHHQPAPIPMVPASPSALSHTRPAAPLTALTSLSSTKSTAAASAALSPPSALSHASPANSLPAHQTASTPQTFHAIEREQQQQLAASKAQYYDRKHELKAEMPRTSERKELIRGEQEQRHERDKAVNDKADAQKVQLMVDNARRTLESRDSSNKDAGDNSQRSSAPTARSGPSVGQAAAIIAATIAADRLNTARNTAPPPAYSPPAYTIHIGSSRGGGRSF